MTRSEGFQSVFGIWDKLRGLFVWSSQSDGGDSLMERWITKQDSNSNNNSTNETKNIALLPGRQKELIIKMSETEF